MKLLRNFPIETYVLLIPAVIFLIYFGMMAISCYFTFSAVCRLGFLNASLMNIVRQVGIFASTFIILLAFVIFLVIRWLFFIKPPKKDIYYFFRSLIFVFGMLFVLCTAMILSVQLLFNFALPAKIANISLALMRLDHWIFGVYPSIFLNNLIHNNFISKIIYSSYLNTVLYFMLGVVLAVFSSQLAFRKLVLSFFISFAIGLPVWFILPAIAPSSMFQDNILHMEIPQDISYEINHVNLTEYVKENLKKLHTFWIDENEVSFAVSTFPSMHAAWGIILAIIIMEFSKYSKIVMLPWLFFELVGAVYSFQHYAVDILAGLIIAIMTLLIVNWLLKIEKKYFVDKYKWFLCLDIMKSNFRKIFLKINDS